MADQSTSVQSLGSDANGSHADALAARDEEILRLRDLLITRDAELGAALGRLSMIEQGSTRISDAAARIPIPGVTRLLHALIRLMQRSLR